MDANTKKMMTAFAVIALVLLVIISAGKDTDATNTELTITAGDTPEMIDRANAVLPVVIKACPGIKKYQSEFEFIRAESAQLIDFEDGVAIHFLVKTNNNLPTSIQRYSAGHNCWITVSKNLRIDIAKRACNSVCIGHKF
ncbi:MULTISPECIES: hypothetical protein [unclassified Oceanobacter]|uniref:hypothetical protein n=1 Tax=unclassified Oceanobacter TaxID=2620260 RepID=UPI0027374A89|nr:MULTISPECIES: hypothetical protein [unclassified Oceanobacter]MDP2607965.1 hypothetical protein [Oceanobacter sp. 1_MG-2023]MDP2611373.1 hypothetical protein [Oceanobacter sp. 2_MG-2023]